VNTHGFYCTAAHGQLAPFRGPYNAQLNLLQTAPMRTRAEPELEKVLVKLLRPDRQTLDEVVAERELAVQWAEESLADIEQAKPHLSDADYVELSHYVRRLRDVSRLWREMGELFFTSLAIYHADGIPADLLERLRGTSERALQQGRRIRWSPSHVPARGQQRDTPHGPGAWPVTPDYWWAGEPLEDVIAGLWAEVLDKTLGLELLPLSKVDDDWDKKRLPRTDAERIYLALLQTAADAMPREIGFGGSPELARLECDARGLVVHSARGQRLVLPLAMRVDGDAWNGSAPHRLRIASQAGALRVRVEQPITSSAPSLEQLLDNWLDKKLLPPDEAKGMMRAFVEEQIQPLPIPATHAEWLGRRDALRREILSVVGIDDLVPPSWDLALKEQGTIRRDGYRIAKITFESYPGLTIPALLYIPDNISGRVPGLVSISGHTPLSKAADYIQRRNVNLALRGCVVLCYDYYGFGDRRTGNDPDGPVGANGHDLTAFSFSRRSATAIETLDAIRALDVLAARPEVDPERLGFTGESGGSNTSYWMAALDSRLKLIVPVCSVTTYDYWIRTDVNWDWHQRPPGIRRLGWPKAFPDVKSKKIGQEVKGSWLAEFWIIESEPGIRLPVIRVGKKGEAGPITLVPGRDHEDIARILRSGRTIVAVDLRGTGETAGAEGVVKNWAWFAGRPLPGMRALDLVQAARFCRETLAATGIAVDAENAYGLAALLAGAAVPDLIASGNVRAPWASQLDQLRTQGDHARADVPGLLDRIVGADEPLSRQRAERDIEAQGESA
jgi:hypothetical protein